MGRDAPLRHGVHPLGADLDFDPPSLFGGDGGVERFVAVGFGDGDPVAHPLGIGRVEIRDDRIDRPALLLLLFERTVQDDTDGEDVIYPSNGTCCLRILFQIEKIDLVRLLT